MIRAAVVLVVLLMTGFVSRIGCAASAGEPKYPRFCVTIAVDLRTDRREEVSAIDLTIENASVVSIPRFPLGWGLKIQNHVDNTPATISGGATGNVAELRASDLRCLLEIEDSVPGTPPIGVTGSINVSNGRTERRLILQKSQIFLQQPQSR